jgi:hypothetical protein
MSQKLAHDVTKTITPIFYQCYVALEKCFDLMENESVYIETYGDVTVVSENESSQTEVKNYEKDLTDLSHNIWETLKNWLNDPNITSYKNLILLTTQNLGSWLYSHVTLFLALHKFFCSLGEQSLIPPILFLDQSSQVYFPTSIKDDKSEFNIDDIEAKKGTDTKDEDLRAVTNLFNQLVSFCKTTFEETGIEPQIIVTDHADHLTLDNNVDFESLVNGRRWRKRGFIYPVND